MYHVSRAAPLGLKHQQNNGHYILLSHLGLSFLRKPQWSQVLWTSFLRNVRNKKTFCVWLSVGLLLFNLSPLLSPGRKISADTKHSSISKKKMREVRIFQNSKLIIGEIIKQEFSETDFRNSVSTFLKLPFTCFIFLRDRSEITDNFFPFLQLGNVAAFTSLSQS